MNSERIAQVWNQAVGLTRPDVGALRAGPGLSELRRVFNHAPGLLSLGDNLLITTPLGVEVGDRTPVQSLLLVTTDKFFAAGAQVSTEHLPPFSILGVDVCASAQSVLERFKAAGLTRLSLATESNGWVIYFAQALGLRFLPDAESPSDPSSSDLISVEFFYGPRYEFEQRPRITFNAD